MIDTLWFGNTAKFVEIPVPDLPFTVEDMGYSEGFGFDNGGYVESSTGGFAKRYDFTYQMHDSSELWKIRRFRQGSYGTGLIRFADPMAFESNLFSAAWAEPGLIEGGEWPSIYDAAPTSYASVSANSYDQPSRKAVFTITQAANTAPSKSRSRFIIPIPPPYTLRLGVSGAATGTAVVTATAYNIAAASSVSSNLTLLTDTSSTRLNASFAGSSYDYVAVDFRRTTSATSTLTITSMLAQLFTTASGTPALIGNHIPGEGHTGLRFFGGSQSSGYRMVADQKLRSQEFSLVEVGAWQSS